MEQAKWAVVTGADRGVGLSLAKGLMNRGYHVLAGQYSQEEGELQELGRTSGGRLFPVALDIGSGDSVKAAVETAAALTDRIDILINNGAILGDITATVQDELDFEEMEQVYKVNAIGSLRMSNGLMGLILNSGSKLIVNISSEAGSIGNCWRTGWFAYCMSKAALNMQSRLIQNQIGKVGGKVMVIHPGHVQTYMQGKLDASGKLTPAESAEHILGLVEERLRPDYPERELVLIDYENNKLPW